MHLVYRRDKSCNIFTRFERGRGNVYAVRTGARALDLSTRVGLRFIKTADRRTRLSGIKFRTLFTGDRLV